MRVVPRRAGGELGHVERAQLDGAGGIEPVEDDRRGPPRHLRHEPRAARRRGAAPPEHVLVRERYTLQRAGVTAIEAGLRLPGGIAGAVGSDVGERVEACLCRLRAIEAGVGQLDGADPAGAQGVPRRDERPRGRVLSHRTPARDAAPA